ncbi:MAG: hypothetical protein Crog4KO_06210 [Crocinitomicaceae bacterium]
MKTNLLLLFVAICSLSAFGQNDYGQFDKYNFEYHLPETFDPSLYQENIENEDSSIVMLDRNILSLTMYPGGTPKRHHISHKIYYIGNESDIEKINRLYLYAGRSSNDIYVNVRTTTEDGREIMLDESKMEDVSREEGSANYKILAISGIEAHSWVEVLVIQEQRSTHKRVTVDNPFPTKLSEVYVHGSEKFGKRYPKTTFRWKSYGKYMCAEMYEENRSIRIENARSELVTKPLLIAKDVVPYAEENYSHEYANYTYVDLVDADYTWEDAGNGLGNQIFSTVKYGTNGRNMLRGLDLMDKSDLEKLKGIENFVKNEIKKTASSESDYSDTWKIWKKRIGNETGIVKITEQMLNAADLKYRLYLCSDKDYIQIDESFAFTNGLQDWLFFFPELDLYMIPTNGIYFSGEIPNYLASNMALLLKNTTEIDQEERVIRLLDADPAYNVDGTRASITIDELEEKVTVEKTKMFYGDRAIRSRGYYHFSDEDERKEYINELLIDDTEMELSDVEVRNEDIALNFQSKDTIYFSGVLEGDGILSSIPNGFILNPGGIMGTQTSFYDTEDRIADIYLPESKTYEHTITINIPEGYKVEGTENLEFDEFYFASKRWLYGETEEDAKATEFGQPVAKFVSTVETNDQQIRINITEFYVEGFYPKDGLEDLQSVVNAAYEFFIAKIKLVKE